MDKKDIYEHLANIYLDASSNRKKKVKKNYNKWFFLTAGIFVSGFVIFLFILLSKNNKTDPYQVALVFYSEPVKINFHFDPAKKEIFSINLNKLNLASYEKLGFSLKKSNYSDTISLRVEFTNSFNENAYIYLEDIPHNWQEYKIALADFKNITDWSEMSALSFIVEEWNVKEKGDVVYIDNIRILR